MKNLANCKPSEFLKQTNRIRKVVAKWLDLTKIMEIRKHIPDITEDMTDEQKRKAFGEQARKNLSDIFDAALEEHPQETLELLGYLCFVEPDDVDNHPMSEYLQAFGEIMNDEAVVSFFFSLARLGQMNTSIAPKA